MGKHRRANWDDPHPPAQSAGMLERHAEQTNRRKGNLSESCVHAVEIAYHGLLTPI
jgi:hypothetical protein